MEACLHGEETLAFSDRGYPKANRTIEQFKMEVDLMVLTPTNNAEHPLRVVKRQFGFVKVRYRGLVKNTGQIVKLFALANLWLARKRLLPLMGEVCP